MKKELLDKIIKDFEEKYPKRSCDIPPDRFRSIIRIDNGSMNTWLSQAISTAYQSTIEEAIEELGKVHYCLNNDGEYEVIAEIKSKLEKLKNDKD